MIIFRFKLLAVLSLAACSPSEHADMSTCATLADVIDIPQSADALKTEERADRCVQRNAYKLAVAQGSNGEIVEAALRACDWEILAVGASVSHRENFKITRDSVQMSDQWSAAKKDELRKSGLLWVIQSRAGKCNRLFKEIP